MKILFVNHFPLTGSGSGVYTANLAKSLAKLGHEIAIIFPENRINYETFNDIKLYPVFFKNVDIIDGQLNFNFPCFTTHPRSTFSFKEMTNEEKMIYEQAFYNKIEYVINEFNPDIIHAQHLWTLAGISSVIAQKYNIPLIVTCHGTDLIGIEDEISSNEYWGRNYAQKACDYASSIVTISIDNKHNAEKVLSGVDHKTKWIKNGIDTNIFYKDDTIKKKDVLQALNVEKTYDKVISFVGKLTEIKGVDTLLNAASIYEDDNTLTIIAGDGECALELNELASELNLKNVIFIGNQPQDVLRNIYNIANVSIVPSRKEAFGLVAAESIACGTPVIATSEGGLKEIVSEDVGILFDKNDYKTLAQDILDILNNRKIFDSDAIAKKIKDNYSQDILIKEFISVYHEAINNKTKVR